MALTYSNYRSNKPQENFWKCCFATLSKIFLVWVWARARCCKTNQNPNSER